MQPSAIIATSSLVPTPASKLRLSAWWIHLLRRLQGLPKGEHVVVITVAVDGRRMVRIVTLPEV